MGRHAMKMASLVVVICALVATTEPTPLKVPPGTALENRIEYSKITVLSAFLSALSGMVNAVCILDMGMTVAHHTGNASHAGRLWGINATIFLASMVGFVVGAGVAGFNKCDGENLYAGRYSPGLLSAAIAVAAAVVIQWTTKAPLVSVPLFAFSQGLQNAITRKF